MKDVCVATNRAAFLQGKNTIDTYGPQYHETKASMGPRG